MTTKPGRNDPCPCGSGKKFKKCCALTSKPTTNHIDINQLLTSAVQLQRNGDIEQAKKLYQEVLQHDPKNDNALNLLGVIAHNTGDLDLAANLISRALKIDPAAAEFHFNLAKVLQDKGNTKKAMFHYQKALKSHPDLIDARINLGLLYFGNHQFDEAQTHYKRVLQLEPNNIEAHKILGLLYFHTQQYEKARTHYQRVLQLEPDNIETHKNLGLLYFESNQLEEARSHYQRVLQLQPDSIEAHKDFAAVLMRLCKYEEAIQIYKSSLSINPTYVPQMELGNAFYNLGKPEDAIVHFKRALDLASESERAVAYSNILLVLNYLTKYTPNTIYNEHLKFSREFAEPLAHFIPTHNNNPEASRRIKIGYVSGDFKGHSVAYFISPVLAHHDPDQVEVYCYYNYHTSEPFTKKIMKQCHHWREIFNMNDGEVAKLIQKDKIDILIDLSGHSAYNRLLVFARKPAPIQVSWIGYPNTTGLSTMDYRITDNYADPDGITDQFYTERLVRLPECFSCFSPPDESPEVSNLPVIDSGLITFGTFNKLTKITPDVIKVWAQILLKLPNSQLLLKTYTLQQDSVKSYLLNAFASNGVDSSRIIFMDRDISQYDHLDKYSQIDIALDTFPYNGTTTTCEALWMGVPVIVLEGNSHVSRVGVSQLNNLGLPELIAENLDDYVRIAIDLATDLNKLSGLRKNMRERMSKSPLMDAARLTRNIEKVYRDMWNEWCLNHL